MPYLKNAGLLAAAAMLASAALVSAQTPEPLPVCVGADRVVRHAPEERCGPGFTYYLLQERALGVSGKEGENAPADVAELRKQIDFLRERMAQLEKHVDDELEMAGRMSHQVMAPFEVLDKKLNPDPPGHGKRRRSQAGLVTIRPAGGGQNFAVQFRTPGGAVAAQMGVGKSGAGVADRSRRKRQSCGGSCGDRAASRSTIRLGMRSPPSAWTTAPTGRCSSTAAAAASWSQRGRTVPWARCTPGPAISAPATPASAPPPASRACSSRPCGCPAATTHHAVPDTGTSSHADESSAPAGPRDA